MNLKVTQRLMYPEVKLLPNLKVNYSATRGSSAPGHLKPAKGLSTHRLLKQNVEGKNRASYSY